MQLKVFYTWEQSQDKVYDPGFGIHRTWDIPLLNGYDYEFVKNISTSPGSSHFKGIINPDIIAKIELYQPDAILVFGWSFVSHLKILKHFKGKVPVWFRGDSTLLDEQAGLSFKKILRRLFLKWVFRNVDKAFYVGLANKEYFLKHGLKESQLVFAPHAIDNDRFSADEDAHSEHARQWRSELGIKEHEIVFLFAGKLEPKKNPELLIEAFIKAQRDNAHLVMVGNGILEKDLKQKYAFEKRIHFIDFQNQLKMPVVYRLGDVFVLPSQGPGETWGLAINEAMACGRPILASNKCGGASDLVMEGENGFIFHFTDLHLLSSKIQWMAENEEKLLLMGKKSQQIISNWTYQHVCSSIENEILKTK